MMGTASPHSNSVTPGLTRGPAAFRARHEPQAGPRIKSGVTMGVFEGAAL